MVIILGAYESMDEAQAARAARPEPQDQLGIDILDPANLPTPDHPADRLFLLVWLRPD